MICSFPDPSASVGNQRVVVVKVEREKRSQKKPSAQGGWLFNIVVQILVTSRLVSCVKFKDLSDNFVCNINAS